MRRGFDRSASGRSVDDAGAPSPSARQTPFDAVNEKPKGEVLERHRVYSLELVEIEKLRNKRVVHSRSVPLPEFQGKAERGIEESQ